jgi:hypothetical protein
MDHSKRLATQGQKHRIIRLRAKRSKRLVLLKQFAGTPLGRLHTKSALRTVALYFAKCTSSH